MELITLDLTSEIARITINRPEALNALNEQVLEELLEAIDAVSTSRVAILTGSGEKAFIAGADIKAMQQMHHTDMLDFCELGQAVTTAMEASPTVFIGAVNGFALGGGLEMALACDFIYASHNAKLGLPEVSLGIIPGFGGTQRLAAAVGTRMAKELVTTGKMITAEEGQRIGLINQVCSPEELLSSCTHTAEKILKNAPFAVSQAALAVHRAPNLALSDGLELERQMCAVCFATDERVEGMSAFIEKRPAKFSEEVVHAD